MGDVTPSVHVDQSIIEKDIIPTWARFFHRLFWGSKIVVK